MSETFQVNCCEKHEGTVSVKCAECGKVHVLKEEVKEEPVA